jgi:hypothetical protein
MIMVTGTTGRLDHLVEASFLHVFLVSSFDKKAEGVADARAVLLVSTYLLVTT